MSVAVQESAPRGLLDRCQALVGRYSFPDRTVEEWKYLPTSLAQAMAQTPATEPSSSIQPEDLAQLPTFGCDARVTLVNGRYVAGLSFNLSQFVSIEGAGLQDVSVEARTDVPAALALLHSEPVKLTFGAGKARVHVLHLSDAPDAVIHASLQVLVRNAAKVEIIEEFAPSHDTSACNVYESAVVGDSASLRWNRLQTGGNGDFLTSRLDVQQSRGSAFTYRGFDLGGAVTRHEINCDLIEEGAESVLDGLYALAGSSIVDNHTRVNHRVKNTSSSEYFKGVLDGRSRAIFNGKVYVAEGADGTDAQQANHNLLLSDKAEIDTKPELEIYADDVKCAHGATVGQMDPAQQFYLQSRGIPAPEARTMLIEAFAQEMIDRVDDAELSEYLASRLGDSLAPQEDS